MDNTRLFLVQLQQVVPNKASRNKSFFLANGVSFYLFIFFYENQNLASLYMSLFIWAYANAEWIVDCLLPDQHSLILMLGGPSRLAQSQSPEKGGKKCCAGRATELRAQK